jgi:hypothetical protein
VHCRAKSMVNGPAEQAEELGFSGDHESKKVIG